MSDAIRVDIDAHQLADVTELLIGIKNGVEKAQMWAHNRTASGTVTVSKKKIADVLNLSQKRIAADFYVKKAWSGDTSCFVRAKGKKIELIEYGATITAKGVSYKVRKDAGAKSVKASYFIQRGKKSGDLLVIGRISHLGTGKPIGMAGPGSYFVLPRAWPAIYREPVFKKYGPSIPATFESDEVMPPVLTDVAERLSKNLDQAANSLIKLNQPADDGWQE